MSTAHLPNRLAKLVHQPGGQPMEAAVRAAETNLHSIRAEVIAEIEAILERMHAIEAAGRDAQTMEQLYTLSNSVLGMAGLFGMTGLGQVCYSLCELLDRFMSHDVQDDPALRVHMESLQLLRPGTTHDEGQQAAIVAALRRIVVRV